MIKPEPSAIRCGLALGHLRKGMAAARILLVKEAAQHLVERRIRETLKWRALVLLIGHLFRAGLLGDRDVDHRRQHLFDQRGEALLLDQRRR